MFRPLDEPVGAASIDGLKRKNLEILAASLFSREINHARLDALIARISGRSMRMLDLHEIRPHDPACSRAELGIQTVPIDRIRGSESRCDDFDSNLRPRHDHERQRWINVAVACMSGASLPAVELIHLCGFYFVRDGHHRISVARAMGARFIDAYVVAS